LKQINERALEDKILVEAVNQLYNKNPSDFTNGRRLSADGKFWEDVNFETGEVSNREPA
jgi:hypothetical protein